MPAILLVAFGFPAGLAAGLMISWSPWILAPLAAALAVYGRWFVVHGCRLPSTINHQLSTVCVALAAGIIWGGAALRVRNADCRLRWGDGERVTVMAEPRDRVPMGDERRPHRYDIREPHGCAGLIQVQLPRAETTDGVLAIVGTWRRDPEFAAGPFPRRAERAGRLMASLVSATDDEPGRRSRLRVGAERRLGELFGPTRWPLAAALTVSPDAAVPKGERQAFARAGLAHILSISGLHVAILAGALIIILRACRLRPDRARIAGTLIVAAYIWMLGFPAPALRSGCLLAVWCWARARQRPPVPFAILAVTLIVVLLVDPWAIFEPGPWLSFAGVWGCASAARWWERVVREAKHRRARRNLRLLGPAVVSAGAVLATTPIQMIAFGSMTPVAILANLVAIPIAGFATPALALTLLLSAIPGASPLAAWSASAAGVSLDLLELVARKAAEPSWATVPAASVAGAVVAAALALYVLRAGPRRRPARHTLAARCALGTCVLATILIWEPALGSAGAADGDGRLTLHFLDVGQGDAEAVRTPHGHWIVIDGGPRSPGMDAGARRVVPFLERHGVRRLDLVVASHGDADHLGGLPAVLKALPTGAVMEQGAVDGRPLYREWLTMAGNDHARWLPARAGERFVIDDVTVRIWHPDSATIAGGWPPNDNSVVLTVEYGAFRAIFGGDAGLPMEALRAGQVGRVTVLKVGHHGSRTATSEPWIAALRPVVCVIEVGAHNTYGHPDPGTVARLMDSGCGIWRTDRDGDVRISTDGTGVTVHGASRDTSFLAGKEHP